MDAPQVLKLQWLNNYVIIFLLKKSQLQVNKFADNLTGFLYPYDRCAPPYPYLPVTVYPSLQV